MSQANRNAAAMTEALENYRKEIEDLRKKQNAQAGELAMLKQTVQTLQQQLTVAITSVGSGPTA